jgi:hypothetical protein
MAARMTLSERFHRKMPRLMKSSRQWLRIVSAGGQRPRSRVLFVFGSQRSGTRLPLQILDRSPDIVTFSEGSAPFFDGVMLKPLPEIDRLVGRSMFPVVTLKPICETHRVHELLEHFPGSRAIWIFRRYQDCVNSASRKWSSGRESLRRLAAGDLKGAGWRAGGLTPQKLALVRELYREDLSEHAANAVMWYLRNDLYFDLRVYERPDVLLSRYEDLVERPSIACVRMFDFAGLPVPRGYDKDVYASSVAKRPFPAIPDNIRQRCDALEERLTGLYDAGGGAVVDAAS